MLFTGPELSEVLGRSGNEIELRNQFGRCCRVLSRDEALKIDRAAIPPLPPSTTVL